jgi:hypothetical protein
VFNISCTWNITLCTTSRCIIVYKPNSSLSFFTDHLLKNALKALRCLWHVEGIWIPVYLRDIGWLVLCNTKLILSTTTD